MAERSQTSPLFRRMRPETSAWVLLWAFFALFCLLMAGLLFLGWRYYGTAMRPLQGQIRAFTGLSTIQFRAAGSTTFGASVDQCAAADENCFTLYEGDTVRATREAGYGKVAELNLADTAQIQLWAHPLGAELTLDNFAVSRFTGERKIVQLTQRAGYVRYDLAAQSAYPRTNYRVMLSQDVTVELAGGGSYSIDVPQPIDGTPNVRAMSTHVQPMAEIAVRSGTATVTAHGQQVVIRPDEKLAIDPDGAPGDIMAAEWQLIGDGTFALALAQQRANQPVTNWRLYREPGVLNLPRDQLNGQFNVTEACSPRSPDACQDGQEPVAQLRREGVLPATTGVTQTLDVDVSEYPSLIFSGNVRIVKGDAIDELNADNCPLTIRLYYRQNSPADEQEYRNICIYPRGDEDQIMVEPGSTTAEQGQTSYIEVPRFQWERVEINLREDPTLRSVKYLQRIELSARGTAYIVELNNLSLVGRQ